MFVLKSSLKVHGILLCSMLVLGFLPLQADVPKTTCGVDSLGNAVAVWTGTDSTGALNVLASTFRVGSTWSTASVLSTSGINFTDPIVVVDSSNNIVVIWSSLDTSSGVYILWSSMLTAGGSGKWTTPVQLSLTNTSVREGSYSLAINSNKNVVAVWNAWDSTITTQGIYTSTVKIGGSWATATKVSP